MYGSLSEDITRRQACVPSSLKSWPLALRGLVPRWFILLKFETKFRRRIFGQPEVQHLIADRWRLANVCGVMARMAVSPHTDTELPPLVGIRKWSLELVWDGNPAVQTTLQNCGLFILLFVRCRCVSGWGEPWELNFNHLSATRPINGGTRWRSWLRHCATNRKVAGSIPDGGIGIFHWHNPSGRSMALGSTQCLTEMSTRNISWGVKLACA